MVQTKKTMRTMLSRPAGLNSGEPSYDDIGYNLPSFSVSLIASSAKICRLVQLEQGGKEFHCRSS